MTSNAFKDVLGGAYFGKRSSSVPDTLYFGISTTAIGEYGGGITEPLSSTGYSRAAIANTADEWEITNGAISNKNEITMSKITSASGDGVALFLSDSPTGNAIIWQNLNAEDYRPLVRNSFVFIRQGEATFNILDHDAT